MTTTIEIRDDFSLTFKLPTSDDMRGAFRLKTRLSDAMSGTDEDAQLAVFAEVQAVLGRLLVGSSDQTETLEGIRDSALFFGATGVTLWMELHFRNYREAHRAAQ